jgi:multidrug efflux pump subunit AcrB
VDGVAGVDISGGAYRQINVFMDLDKLNGYQLTPRTSEGR